jgi:hypothetical protein
MFPVATAAGGQCTAPADVCLTPAPPPAPPTPQSYLNMGSMLLANRATCAKKVTVLSQPVLLVNSEIAVTSGDEAGALGGIISKLIKGLARATKGSAKVSMEGLPVVYQTCTFSHNGVSANAPLGIHDTPSQTKVFVAP